MEQAEADYQVIDSNNDYYPEKAAHVLAAVKSHQQSGMITGVVVTGTKDQLKSLGQLPFIKAATLGATVDMY
ncbi:anti sigma factor C-terminal domain-containing protein [Paenibacillus sp. YPG26]|uniref:anti sigma factor C-terminal domain-containing protein n=1 Tax=Paenibacillus sp. YPG26 TaxID=2878915 RepID=UPI00203D44B0|nr:anti sigma factor C-terminal domain-containing protein [Paenibacillus sp. YPG26]USB32981.1 anti-sigma factor C-terminal domain-containing protein [Paenibacillus sp. YPG26]